MVRDQASAARLWPEPVEVVEADVRDRASVERSVAGTRAVVSALTGFARGGGPRAVDFEGNRMLMRAAERAGVERFVLTSILDATQDHSSELYRMKYRAERELMVTGLAWTIVRPTVLMETWATLIGQPIADSRRVRLVGDGDNPINFVSVRDVARFAELALTGDGLNQTTLDVGGPANLTLNEVVALFEEVIGRRASVIKAPVPVMRAVSALMRPFSPALARILEAAVALAAADMTFDALPVRTRYPSVPMTDFREVAVALGS